MTVKKECGRNVSAVAAAARKGEAVGPGVRVEKSFHQGYPWDAGGEKGEKRTENT